MGLLVLRVAGVPTEHHPQTQGPCQQSFQTAVQLAVGEFKVKNMAKGTTDPRVEFISQVLTQIAIKSNFKISIKFNFKILI